MKNRKDDKSNRFHFSFLLFLLLGVFLIPSFAFAAQTNETPWSLKIKVNGYGQEGINTIGIHPEATDGFDVHFDILSSTDANTQGKSYILPHFSVSTQGEPILFSAQINAPEARSSWELHIRTSVLVATPMIVTWGNVSVDSEATQLTLIGQDSEIDMLETKTYSYTADAGLSDHVLIIEFIDLIRAPDAVDTDGDGMTDMWEEQYGLDPNNPNDAKWDSDEDKLSNLEEFRADTDPTQIDTDGDGIPDAWELKNGLDPNNPSDAISDMDKDGVSNADEIKRGDDPFNPADNVPVANAGEDQTQNPDIISFTGSASADPNNDVLSYHWEQNEGNPDQVVFRNNGTYHGMTQDIVLIKDGSYEFILTVFDGNVYSQPDSLIVTINNLAPTADAGVDQTVKAKKAVTLDGSASADPNDNELMYNWKQTAGEPLNLLQVEAVSISFIPQESGVYKFALTVTDTGGLSSEPDTVVITVNDANKVPTADAGTNKTVNVNTKVTLDGTRSSDSDQASNATLTYEWSVLESPAEVILSSSTSSQPEFTPGKVGIYRFALKVSDGEDTSAPDEVTITVNGENTIPVADAGEDQAAKVGDTVTLGGGRSTDGDGDALAYTWTQKKGTIVALTGADSMTATFPATRAGNYVFSLVVSDGKNNSLADLVNIQINASENHMPIAHAGVDITGQVNTAIKLDGSKSSDPDGDKLTYQWTQLRGSNVTLNGVDTLTPDFTPTLEGNYTFSLIVTDVKGGSDTDEVNVTVIKDSNRAPTAKIVYRRVVKKGRKVVLDGTKSRDPDNDKLSYKWKQTRGASVILAPIGPADNPNAKMSFTPTQKGRYKFKLVVNDGHVDSAAALARIYVIRARGTRRKIAKNSASTIEVKHNGKTVKVTIPEGAVNEEVEIGVTLEGGTSGQAENGMTAFSNVVDLVPSDLTLLKEIEIIISLNEETKAMSQGTDSLNLYKYNEETDTWEVHSEVTKNEDGTVTAYTKDLSRYTVGKSAQEDPDPVGSPPADKPAEEGGDSGGGSCFISLIGE